MQRRNLLVGLDIHIRTVPQNDPNRHPHLPLSTLAQSYSGFPYLRGVREEPEQLLRAHHPRPDVMDCVHHRPGRLHPRHARGVTERHPRVRGAMPHAIIAMVFPSCQALEGLRPANN
jgi:hypothetical protein